MDVLAVNSAVDITCEHNAFEAEMRALRTNAVALGSVEVGVWSVCMWYAVSACSAYSHCLLIVLQLSQLQVASKKVQDRLKELVCSVHTSLAKGYK